MPSEYKSLPAYHTACIRCLTTTRRAALDVTALLKEQLHKLAVFISLLLVDLKPCMCTSGELMTKSLRGTAPLEEQHRFNVCNLSPLVAQGMKSCIWCTSEDKLARTSALAFGVRLLAPGLAALSWMGPACCGAHCCLRVPRHCLEMLPAHHCGCQPQRHLCHRPGQTAGHLRYTPHSCGQSSVWL